MNGSPIPAANLTFGGACAILWWGALAIVNANQWMIIPGDVITPSAIAVNFIASHLWDWKTGDNKPV